MAELGEKPAPKPFGFAGKPGVANGGGVTGFKVSHFLMSFSECIFPQIFLFTNHALVLDCKPCFYFSAKKLCIANWYSNCSDQFGETGGYVLLCFLFDLNFYFRKGIKRLHTEPPVNVMWRFCFPYQRV